MRNALKSLALKIPGVRRLVSQRHLIFEEISGLKSKLSNLQNREGAVLRANVPPVWDGFDQYETSVTLALKDLISPGEVVFDVGANLGGLSLTISRLVGPFGKVISFEVSPRIIPQLISNLDYWIFRGNCSTFDFV